MYLKNSIPNSRVSTPRIRKFYRCRGIVNVRNTSWFEPNFISLSNKIKIIRGLLKHYNKSVSSWRKILPTPKLLFLSTNSFDRITARFNRSYIKRTSKKGLLLESISATNMNINKPINKTNSPNKWKNCICNKK